MKSLALVILMICYSSTLLADSLARRNPYGLTNYIESAHFTVYWGTGMQDSELQPLLDALEVAWQELIIKRGYQRPITMKENKLNLYVSQTGQPVLDDQLNAVQYWDIENHEVIVFNKNKIKEDDFMKSVTAHELFHAIQSSYLPEINTEPFLFLENLDWTHESQAAWVSQIVWPELKKHKAENHLTTFSPYPQYSLDTVTATDPIRTRVDFHRYGTYIFFNHLTETLNDDDFVKYWLEYLQELRDLGVRNTSTLDEMKTMVFNRYNQSLESLFATFIARNSVWDYPDRDIYLEVFAEQDHFLQSQHTARLHTSIENKWYNSPTETAVRRWGANYIHLKDVNLDKLTIGFEGNTFGNKDKTGEWHVTAVLDKGDVFEYVPLVLVNGQIQNFELSTIEVKDVWLAIAFTTDSNDESEVFAFRYQFAETGQFEVSPNTPVSYPKDKVTAPSPDSDKSGGTLVFLVGFLLCFICRRFY
ncbi:MAG: DUF6055 domain-containing protein [Colwellia sp.]|nr:DUF6055 domain-containing protein [Colwellia sp.]